jgi:hypothetical protein
VSAEDAIYELLIEATGLTDLVGDRVFPVSLPQDSELPAVLVNQLDEAQQLGKDGPVPNGWTFQIDIVAGDNPTARGVARAVKSALNWRTYTLGDGQRFRCVFDDEADADTELSRNIFQIVQDFRARRC